jgi:hypothetical protein
MLHRLVDKPKELAADLYFGPFTRFKKSSYAFKREEDSAVEAASVKSKQRYSEVPK